MYNFFNPPFSVIEAIFINSAPEKWSIQKFLYTHLFFAHSISKVYLSEPSKPWQIPLSYGIWLISDVKLF